MNKYLFFVVLFAALIGLLAIAYGWYPIAIVTAFVIVGVLIAAIWRDRLFSIPRIP